MTYGNVIRRHARNPSLGSARIRAVGNTQFSGALGKRISFLGLNTTVTGPGTETLPGDACVVVWGYLENEPHGPFYVEEWELASATEYLTDAYGDTQGVNEMCGELGAVHQVIRSGDDPDYPAIREQLQTARERGDFVQPYYDPESGTYFATASGAANGNGGAGAGAGLASVAGALPWWAWLGIGVGAWQMARN